MDLPADKLLEKYTPDFAMAYGSGVFRQASYKDEKPMVDFVFGVNSIEEWHEKNLKENREDYSSIAKLLGMRFIKWIHERGCKIYYNPYVMFEGNEIKYGVISEKELLKDLNEWETLYIAGRLHKPSKILKAGEEVRKAIENNLESAVNASLLLLNERFPEEELYTTIAGISYTGDVRMKFAENQKKVQNIVIGNFEEFCKLYKDILKSMNGRNINLQNSCIQQDKSPQILSEIYFKLPSNLRRNVKQVNFERAEQVSEMIGKAIEQIVNYYSRIQTINGFMTAGLLKSIRYVGKKLEKAKS